jgi:energy-coupling factor transport system ATP-binding protein
VLSGILKPQGGKIIINNEEINLYKYPGKIFGYSFQNPDEQLFSRSIEEEVLRFNKKESKNISNRRELYLEMFGLNEIHHFHPAEMPYVMRKRIALAATLATDRPWYILDEPTIGQDSDFLDFLTFLFKQLVEQGKGLIIISHSQTFIDKFTPKILYLDKGRITSY